MDIYDDFKPDYLSEVSKTSSTTNETSKPSTNKDKVGSDASFTKNTTSPDIDGERKVSVSTETSARTNQSKTPTISNTVNTSIPSSDLIPLNIDKFTDDYGSGKPKRVIIRSRKIDD